MAKSETINYEQLKAITERIKADKDRGDTQGLLLKSQSSIFIRAKRPTPGIPNKTTKSFLCSHPNYGRKLRSRHGGARNRAENSAPGSDDVPSIVEVYDARPSSSSSSTMEAMIHRQEQISELCQIIRKFPFERTRKEHQLASRLFFDLAPSELLMFFGDAEHRRTLSHVIHYSMFVSYPEADMTVFGNSGLFMILKGTVRPLTMPYLNPKSTQDSSDYRKPTPLLRRKHMKLSPGDCFGTFEKIEGREHNTKLFSVITREPCEFLKISVSDYKRINLKMKEEKQAEKMAVISACNSYHNWPELSIKSMAECVEWQNFPLDTVILHEGEVCPFIGFIKSGHCEIFKSVDAVKTLPNNQKVRMHKQVCMGVLKDGESIGETSMLMKDPLTCSVIARTDVEMGVISESRLQELDATTRTLLLQSAEPTFASVTDDDIHQNFIEQEMKLDWEKLKHKVLLQTINHCGIRPGYGKWSR